MKRKLTSLLCVLVFAISMIPSASALEGDALRAADTLAALNLVDSAGAAVDYNLNNTATRAQAAQLLVRLAGAEDEALRMACVRRVPVPGRRGIFMSETDPDLYLGSWPPPAPSTRTCATGSCRTATG